MLFSSTLGDTDVKGLGFVGSAGRGSVLSVGSWALDDQTASVEAALLVAAGRWHGSLLC